MGQWIDEAGRHRDIRVEQVGEADPLGLGGELERLAVAIEGPGTALGHELEARLILAEEELLRDSTVCGAVGQRNDL